MTFQQFVVKNVQRNSKAYLAYFLSSTFAILVFFLFAVNLFHPQIATTFTSGPVALVLSTGEIAIGFFSLLFILYSVGTFLKTRSDEFGLLMLLGATRRQVNRLIALETMIIGLAAMLMGISMGLLLSKYFLLFASVILEVPELDFYLPLTAILLTIVVFLIIFTLIAILAPLTVRSKEIIELLKGNWTPKAPPKASAWLAVASGVLLAAGYAIVVFRIDIPFGLAVIAALVTAGTYLFYAQLSVFVLKRMTARPHLFLRKTNVLWMSDLVYRMKDNARLLVIITLTCTVSFTSMAAFLSAYQTMDEEYAKSYPLPFSYISYANDAQRQAHRALIASTIEAYGLPYQTVAVPFVQFDDRPSIQTTVALSNHGYNQVAALLNREPVQVQPGEAAIVSVWVNKASSRLTIGDETVQLGNGTYRIVKAVQENIFPEGSFRRVYVLHDADFEQHTAALRTGVYYGYTVPQWTQPAAIAAADVIAPQLTTNFSAGFMYRSAPNWYQIDQLTYKLMLFVGAFISIVFFIAAGSFIYFRFYADVQTEQAKYRSLRRIGLTTSELKHVTTVQLALLFFVPFVMAALHSIFALQTLQSFVATSISGYTLLVLGVFFGALSVYFFLLRSRYVQRLLEVATH